MSDIKNRIKSLFLCKMSLHYVALFFLLTVLNALFWFTADFSRFTPPSDGRFEERLSLFLITEAGPFAFLWLQWNLLHLLPYLLFILAPLLRGLYKPHKIVAKLAGYFGILCWFLFGFFVTGLRIT